MRVIPEFWRRTPPALFPCLLGFISLGLAWRRAADIWPISAWIGEGVLIISCLMFIFTGISYLSKLSIHPSVIFDDLKLGPARGAVSAGSMCLMLLAATLTPYFYGLAQFLWWVAIVQQSVPRL